MKFNLNSEANFDRTNRLTIFVLFICGAVLATVYVPDHCFKMMAASVLNRFFFMLLPIAMAALFGTSLFGVLLLSVDTFIFGVISRCFAGLIIQQLISGSQAELSLFFAMIICIPVFFIVAIFGIGFADRLVEASDAHMNRMSFLPVFVLSAAAMISVFYIID